MSSSANYLNCQIAALQGASSDAIQALLGDFAARAARDGYKVAGIVEFTGAKTNTGCGPRVVRDLATGTVISISQDLGPHSSACNLNPAGIAEACAAVERAIAAGADLVILSKFAKLEAARGGLSDAFRAAIGASLPILTAVSPAMSEAWRQFTEPLSQFLPADPDAIDAWWTNVKTKIADAA